MCKDTIVVQGDGIWREDADINKELLKATIDQQKHDEQQQQHVLYVGCSSDSWRSLGNFHGSRLDLKNRSINALKLTTEPYPKRSSKNGDSYECIDKDGISKNMEEGALLSTLHSHALDGLELPTLTQLSFRKNYISALPINMVDVFYNLQLLDLSSNCLVGHLPDAICQLSRLRTLNVNDNALTSLTGIGTLRDLRHLRAWKNEFKELSSDIGYCTQLRTIMLGSVYGGNAISALPSSLRHLSLLSELDVSNNDLTGLLADIFADLPNLYTLNVSNNALNTLPESLGSLCHLRYLDISRNKLSKLPRTLGKLTHIRRLNASGNDLQEVPEELTALKSPAALTLCENPLRLRNTALERRLVAPPERSFRERVGSVSSDNGISQPMSLVEIAGRAVIALGIDLSELPQDLEYLLKNGRPCTNCGDRMLKSSTCSRVVAFGSALGHADLPRESRVCEKCRCCLQGCSVMQRFKKDLEDW